VFKIVFISFAVALAAAFLWALIVGNHKRTKELAEEDYHIERGQHAKNNSHR
jgi:hypothetical protein